MWGCEVGWGRTMKRLFCCNRKEKLSFEPNLLMAVQRELDPGIELVIVPRGGSVPLCIRLR